MTEAVIFVAALRHSPSRSWPHSMASCGTRRRKSSGIPTVGAARGTSNENRPSQEGATMAKKDKESKKAKKRPKKADKGTKKREEKVEHRARQVGCKTTFPIFFLGSTRRALKAQGAKRPPRRAALQWIREPAD
jgi:hypothetical protein